MNKMQSAICELCSVGFVAKNKKPGQSQQRQHLWRYLYHQNVREAVDPGALAISDAADSAETARLSFTLSMGCQQQLTNGDAEEDVTTICENCEQELETLNKLHQNLEQMRKRVDQQVGRIQKIREESKGQGNADKLEKLARMQMVFAGATMGTESICQTLEFLRRICGNVAPDKPKVPVEATVIKEQADDPLDYAMDLETSEQSEFYQYSSQTEDTNLVLSNPVSLAPDFSASEFVGGLNTQNSEDDLSDNDQDENPTFEQPELQISQPDMSYAFGLLQNVTRKPDKPAMSRKNQKGRTTKQKTKPKQMKQCPICNMVMIANNFAQHRRRHTGEKPYRCEICETNFSQKSTLNQHMLRHSKNSDGRVRKRQQQDPLAI